MPQLRVPPALHFIRYKSVFINTFALIEIVDTLKQIVRNYIKFKRLQS